MAETNELKKLFRSRTNKVFCGVLGGIGEYLNVDPVAVRVLYVILAFMSGLVPLILAYIVLCIIMPVKN